VGVLALLLGCSAQSGSGSDSTPSASEVAPSAPGDDNEPSIPTVASSPDALEPSSGPLVDEPEGPDTQTADGGSSSVEVSDDAAGGATLSVDEQCSGASDDELRAGCWSDSDCDGVCYFPPEPMPPCYGVLPPEEPVALLHCSDGGTCAEFTHCDAAAPDAGADGCAPTLCTMDDECPYENKVCDPDASDVVVDVWGCRVGDCRIGELTCAEDERCNDTSGACERRPCDDPESAPCATGESCNPRTGYCAAPGWICSWAGCGRIHCAEPGGLPCGDGQVCETDAPDSGCRTLHCSEPMATPCGPNQVCDATLSCVDCVTDQDCDCGVCRSNSCRDTPAPGLCAPTMCG
jgi:hypothetical protein